MKIAIHHTRGSFSDRWIQYCEENNIDYKLVNAYDSDIVQQVADCDAFMWHHHHENYKDVLFAKQLLYSLQIAGKKVFPDFNTGWHFDDKVGQKYLLEAIGAPLVPSYVFYTKEDAFQWIDSVDFPKVFKLRGGAGASNVMLAHNRAEARRLVKKAFSRGFAQFNKWGYFKEKWRKWRSGQVNFIEVIKGFGHLFINSTFSKMHAPEKGYVYFQDFIIDNTTDFRVKVVNGNCWAFQRLVRENDFRASGSGVLIFDNNHIPLSLIKIAQSVAKQLRIQSLAFDFVIDKNTNNPLIVEISYCFGFDEKELKNGYWDSNLVFHKEKFNPFYWMIDDLIK